MSSLPYKVIMSLLLLLITIGVSQPTQAQNQIILPSFCDAVTTIPTAECLVLVDLHNSNDLRELHWFNSNNPCEWRGIGCDAGHIKYLDLSHTQLTSLPENFGNLNVHSLYLDNTPLTSLPGTFGNLTALERLDLSHTPLTSLPETFGNLNVRSLGLSHTQLTSLPENFGSLTELRMLNLSHNNLSTLLHLSRVCGLYLDGNPLTGSLSDHIPINKLGGFCYPHLSFSQTNLCIPQNEAYQTWLQTINVTGNGITCTPPSLITEEGGQITSADRQIQLTFPAKAVSTSTMVSYTRLIQLPQTIPHPLGVSRFFQLETSPNLLTFQQPLTIEWSAPSLQAQSTQEPLQVYRWDGTAWHDEAIMVVNQTDDSLIVQTTSSGLFAIVGGETFYSFLPVVAQ